MARDLYKLVELGRTKLKFSKLPGQCSIPYIYTPSVHLELRPNSKTIPTWPAQTCSICYGCQTPKGGGDVKEEVLGPVYQYIRLRLYVNPATCNGYNWQPGRGRHPLYRTCSPYTKRRQDKLDPGLKLRYIWAMPDAISHDMNPVKELREPEICKRIQSPGSYSKLCLVSAIKCTLTKNFQIFHRAHRPAS